MTLTIRTSVPTDRAAILDLMDEARGDDLTAEERAERGAVQGRMDEELLAEFEQGPGIVVAVDEQDDGSTDLAGFAVTSLPQHGDPGPRGGLVDYAEQHFPEKKWAMYGPLAVSRDHQGRGLTRKLLVAAGRKLADYDLGAAFVEGTNRKSLQIHEHYPFTRSGSFTVGDREFVVFTFEPAAFVEALQG